MVGITRICIVSDWDNERLEMSRSLAPAANALYLNMFNAIGLHILPGEEVIHCQKEEAVSRYDWQEGIDVIFQFSNGHKATNQEKFLTYKYGDTATFSETKRNGDRGSWYTCTAQYYFIGYARKYPVLMEFQSYVLIDLPGLHRIDAREQLRWNYNGNKDPRFTGIKFRYLYFKDIPQDVVIAMGNRKEKKSSDMSQLALL